MHPGWVGEKAAPPGTRGAHPKTSRGRGIHPVTSRGRGIHPEVPRGRKRETAFIQAGAPMTVPKRCRIWIRRSCSAGRGICGGVHLPLSGTTSKCAPSGALRWPRPPFEQPPPPCRAWHRQCPCRIAGGLTAARSGGGTLLDQTTRLRQWDSRSVSMSV